MEITLTEKQNLILSRLVDANSELQKEIERNSIRQSELIDVILEYHKIDIKEVVQVNLDKSILRIELKA